MLSEPTRQYISKLGDLELWEYIQAGTDRYEPEAIAFAQEQFELRKVASERIAGIKEEASARKEHRAAEIAEAAERPLGTMGRTLAVIGGCLGLPILLYLLLWYHFRKQGEHLFSAQGWLLEPVQGMSRPVFRNKS